MLTEEYQDKENFLTAKLNVRLVILQFMIKPNNYK